MRVESPRGAIEVAARVGQVMTRAVFAPFHYGTWDTADLRPDRPGRQANELTMTVWTRSPTALLQDRRLPRYQGPRRRRTQPGAHNGSVGPRPRRDAHRPQGPPTGGGAPTTSTVLERTPHYPLDPARNPAGPAEGYHP